MATSGTPLLLTDAASPEAAALLAKLADLPGVSSVNPKPVKPANKPNHFGVSYLLRLPGWNKATTKRSAVTDATGNRPTFIAAVEAAIDSVTAALKEHGINAPHETSMEPPPSTEELEWLGAWIDEQSDPDAIGVEQADAALRSRRAAASGAATAGLLMERQLLDAKVTDARAGCASLAISNPCFV